MAHSELFNGITTTQGNELLKQAFYDWSHGTYPEATCIGDVVALSGLIQTVPIRSSEVYIKETE
ncbi:hypothetical protein KBD20_03020 [Candidatus Saccharibacteria bacterium]|nr:hypothetical protein [Candidatus Saccharibacteria bacterium]